MALTDIFASQELTCSEAVALKNTCSQITPPESNSQLCNFLGQSVGLLICKIEEIEPISQGGFGES